MKKIIISIVVVILIALGVYFIIKSNNSVVVDRDDTTLTDTQASSTPVVNKEMEVIGKSVGGLDITAYNFGNATGTDKVLFVGGIHGGYEKNTVTVSQELIDYLKTNPSVIPANVKVSVIPVLNPDGLAKGEGAVGRFNGNNVDLNRNFDCDWQTNGKWQNKTVSGGTAAFSEPESQAIKSYIEANNFTAVVVYYSAAGGVFSSSCHNGILAETRNLTNTYAKASGYPAHEEFNFYEITGDMVNWLAKENTPAISVLLTNHTDSEWTKNKAGVEALLKYYAK